MPVLDIQTEFPPVAEPLDRVWVMSAKWYGFMGVAIGLSATQYYYWFYSDVISGDAPHYPVVGSYTLKDNVLTLDGMEHHLYSSKWLVTTNAERICLWAERDVGDTARLLIPDERFDSTNPFANQRELKAEPSAGRYAGQAGAPPP